MIKANETYRKKTKRGPCWFIKAIQPIIAFKKYLRNNTHM